MKLPPELGDLVVCRVKLNRKNLMELEAGVFLMSNLFDGAPTKPVFAEKVVSLSKRDEQWKRITKFWMTLFGINFAIGVATGIILEFQWI